MRAPFFRRGLARALDIAVHLIVLEGAARVAHLLPQGSLLQLSERALLGVDVVVGTSAFLLYPALSEWIGGATLGKVAFRVRVVDAEDPTAPLRLSATLKRNLALFVDLLVFGIIAYSAMQRSPRRQRLGDAWARTVVVHQDAAPARPAHRGWVLGLLAAAALLVLSYLVASQAPAPSREDFWKVVGKLTGQPQLCVVILGATGARIGEVAALRWEQIDLTAGQVRFWGKTGHRDVVIPELLVKKLAAIRPATGKGRVLPVGVDTSRTSITQRYLKDACEEGGVRYFTPHGVRRMVIDQYYDNGVDIGTVAAQLGQSPKVALKYYRQATGQVKRRAVALAGIGEEVESNVIKLGVSGDVRQTP